MTDGLKTVVMLSDERLKKEYRHVLGKVDEARIELEILNLGNSLSEEWVEDVSRVQARLFLVDLPREPENGLQIMEQLHQHFPHLPILAAGDLYDPAFLMEAMRLGVKEFLPKPLSAEKLRAAYQRLAKRVFDPGVEAPPAQIFSFFGSKGGNGTTTIATNLAVSLRKHSVKKILLLDLDAHLGAAAEFLGVKPNLYLFQGKPDLTALDRPFISRAILPHPKSGIDVLSLTNGLGPKNGSLAAAIKRVLNLLQRDYDYICVDCSSRLDENVAAALDASHLIFLIAQGSLPALRNAQRILQAFEGLGYSEKRVRLLVNRYGRDETISLKEIGKFLEVSVFWALPNDFNALRQSLELGEPLAQQPLSIPLAKTFDELSAEVLGMPHPPQPKPFRGGFLALEKDPATGSLPLTT